MVEVNQPVKTPFGAGVAIVTSGDQVLVKYVSGEIRLEYRYDVLVVKVKI
jgi:hypothetical protein